jgi:peptidase E
MKTKFILNGGRKKNTVSSPDFYKEILKDVPENATILIVPFAREIETIQITAEKEINEFNAYKWQEKINFIIAEEKSFIEQIKLAEVIYLQGGSSLKLLDVLKKFPSFKELIKNKTVAGESAGANVLCKFFFSPSANKISEGLGLLPIKLIPHYKDEYKNVFKDIAPEMESLNLQEYEYKIF